MSIPERLWRVARGHWAAARERIEDAEAQAAAYNELAEALRQPSASSGARAAGAPASPGTYPAPPAAGQHDPLATSYELLMVEPGAGLEQVEAAHRMRLTELHPEKYPAGSAERAALEARRAAIEAAYQRIRDVLNPTETRFERLEF